MYNMSTVSMKLISEKEKEMYHFVNIVVITNAICLVGFVTNVMNIVVFYKQGFTSTMNVSFFGLAISDLCNIVTLLWYCVCVNPLFTNSEVPMVCSEVIYLTAGVPHICCARITGWITVYITTERCLCIMVPLKIKQIITPRKTTIALITIYVVIISSFLPEYATTYITWKFYPDRNKTLLGLVFTDTRGSLEGLMFILYSILGSVSFAAVIVLTTILVVQLKQKSKWRMTTNEDKSMYVTISNRERKIVIMVIMITIILIVCYTPGVAISMVTFFEPEFSIVGKLKNAFFAIWSFALVFDALNSSVNIFLYYSMSSKYRETFDQIFCVKNNNY